MTARCELKHKLVAQVGQSMRIHSPFSALYAYGAHFRFAKGFHATLGKK